MAFTRATKEIHAPDIEALKDLKMWFFLCGCMIDLSLLKHALRQDKKCVWFKAILPFGTKVLDLASQSTKGPAAQALGSRLGIERLFFAVFFKGGFEVMIRLGTPTGREFQKQGRYKINFFWVGR